MKARSTRVLKSFVLAFAAAVLSAVGAFADGAPTGHTRYVRRYGYKQDGAQAANPQTESTLERMEGAFESYALAQKLVDSQQATISIRVKGLEAGTDNPVSVFGLGAPRMYKNGAIYTVQKIDDPGFGFFFDPADGGKYGVHFGKTSDDASYVTVTAAQTDDKWHLLTATYSGDGASGTVKLYVDGVLAGSAAAGALAIGYNLDSGSDAKYYSYNTHFFHFGYSGNAKSDDGAIALLRGYLADAVVWDVARTDAQVAADAAKALAWNGDEGMIAYWPLEESNQAAKLASWGENLVNIYASLKFVGGSADFATTVAVDDFPVATPAFREGEVKLTLSDDNLKTTVEGAVQDCQSAVRAEVSRLRYDGYVPLCTFAPSVEDGKFTFTTNSLLDILRSDDQVFVRWVSTLTAGSETCSRTIMKTGTKKNLTYTWTGGGDGETWSDPANWSANASWANARGYPGSYASSAVIGAAAKDKTIKATEEIDLRNLTFQDCGAATIDLGGKTLFVGSAEDRFPYNSGFCNDSSNNKILVTNAAPVIANASLAEYRYIAPTAYVTAPDQVFADALITFRDCPDVRGNYMMAVGGGTYGRTDMGVTLDHANLLYRHWNNSSGGGHAEHNFGDVRVVNGGTLRGYDGSVDKSVEMRLGRPGATMYLGPGSKLLNGDVRLGEAGYKNENAEGATRDLSFIADEATLEFGHSVFTPTDTRTGGALRMAYSANDKSGGIGGATGYMIALTNCTSTFCGSENIGIVGGDETKDTPVSNCTFTVSGGTFDAPKQTFYLQGGSGNALRIDNGAEMTVAVLAGGCGSDFVLDDATLDVVGKATFFAGNYAIWKADEPNPRAVFTGAHPHMTAGSFYILNANHPGTLEFAPPAAGWTEPALEFGGAGDFKETGGYHIQVTEPAGGFNPNVISIPLLRFGSSKTTYGAANFPDNLAAGTFILPEGVEVRYDKDTYLLYAYIPAHAELASEIKSASVQCQDYTNLVFSGSLVRSTGTTTVKVVWGDDDAALTNETVLATIARDAEDLTFAGELSFRLGTDIRWRIVSSVVNAGYLFEDATQPRDAATAPWQGSISRIDNKTLLGGVACLPVTIVPGSGENVLTFEYGFEDGIYEKSYELARVRLGGATVFDNPVPLRSNIKVWYRATLTNTDPDGRGTSTATKTGSWTPGTFGAYVWHGEEGGDISNPKNWVGYGDGETRWPTANDRDVVFIEFPEDGVRDFSVNVDADAVCQDLFATNVTLCLTGDGTKTLKMTSRNGHYGAAVLYGSTMTVGAGGCVEMPGNYPQLRGPTTSTLTVANGGILRLLSSNKVLDDCCDAVGAPHRLSVEEGGKLLLLAGNGPGVTLSKEKYLLDLQPGSILAMTNNYNVINIGPNQGMSNVPRGEPMDVVWDGLKAIQTDGDPLSPNSEIVVGSDSSLTICNMTNRVDGMPEIGFVWNKVVTSNAFLHVSNVVLNVSNAGRSSNNRYSGSFRVGFGYQGTYGGARESEMLLEDVTLEGCGFGDFLYSRMSTNTLVTLRNVHGTFSGRWGGTVPSLSDSGALAFDYGYGNTFVLDNSRIYRRSMPELQTSVKLFNNYPGGSDALGHATLVFRGEQPVLSAPQLHVGKGEDHNDWLSKGDWVCFEVPRAGWREAPVQAYDVKSDRTLRFCSSCFRVKVTFPDGLDDTVARIPIADTESGGYEEQYPNKKPFHVPENWELPDGWEAVSDKTAGEIYLKRTGVEDACASFKTKAVLPERHWARATGELASLGRFGNARVLVRWGYGPEEMTQTFEVAAFTEDSDSLAFDARLPVEFPLCTTIWAQYELVSTDPSSGETYAHRGPMMCRELSSAVTTLSDFNFEQRVKGVLSPKFTVKNLGRGTTTVTLEIWPNGDEGASQTFELATFDEEFPGDTSKFVYHPGSLLVVPDKAGSKYSSRFIVTTVDGGTTTVRTYARNDVTIQTPDKGFYWNPQDGSTAWSDAANWIKVGSGMGGGYPNDASAVVFVTGFLLEPQSIVLSEDVTVDDIQFNDCVNTTLDLGGKTLTSVNDTADTKPTGFFIKNSAVRFVNGQYKGVQWYSDRYDPGLGPTDVNKIVLDDGASAYFAGIGVRCNVNLNYGNVGSLLVPTLVVNTNAVFETPVSIWDNNRGRLEIHGGVVRCGGSVQTSSNPSKVWSTVEITDGGVLENGGSYFIANQTSVPTLIADSTLAVSNAICFGYKQDTVAMTTNLSVLVTNSSVTVSKLKNDTWLGLRGFPSAAIDAVFADVPLDVTRIMIGKELQNNGAINNTPSTGARLTFKGAKTVTAGYFVCVHGADNEVVFGEGLSNAFGTGVNTLTVTGTNNWFVACDDAYAVLSNETYKFDSEGGGVRFEGAAPQLTFASSDTKTAKFNVVSDKHETPAGFRWNLPVGRYASAAAVIDVAPANVTLPSVLQLTVEDNPSCVTGFCKRARFPLLKFAQGDSPAIRDVMAASIESATLTTGYAHTEKGGALEYCEASSTLYYIRPSNGIGLMLIVR